MRKLKSLRSSLRKAIVISILVGFIIVFLLSPVVLAFYIATGDDAIIEYLDEEPEESIRGGF